ncbi:acyl-CoA dehydrogenase family protein [Roseateles sp. DB2]|uniref:acyl-CoA dehydrogenase family protein n=1 Tax=Roseateles sp. DB2 TaxID=3453717 RepID=UPI003EED13A1
MNLSTDMQQDMLRQRLQSLGLPAQTLCTAMKQHAARTDETGDIPSSFWEQVNVRALNLNLVPPEHGGDEGLWPLMQRVLLMEQLGYADPALALALPGPGLATPPLLALASKEQQRALFGRFQSDAPVWGGFAITEPDVGSDATALRTSARECSDGYVLNGTKCFITNGARADFVVTFATVDKGRGRFGVRAFAVDRRTPGFQVVRLEKMLGLRGSQLAVLSYADCLIPKENLLQRGDESRLHDAFSGAQSSWDYFRPVLSSVIVGSCARVRDELAEYLEAASPKAVRWRRLHVADMLSSISGKISAARLLCHKAAWRYEQGLPVSKDSSMAKAYASRIAMEIAEAILQTVGLEGLHDRPVFERFYRDAKAYDILEGTGDMQRLMVTRLHQRQGVEDGLLV